MEEVGPYIGMLMPYKEGRYAGVKMNDVHPRTILEMYYTDHLVGLPRMWVVHNLKRLQEACDWKEQDRTVIQNTNKIEHRDDTN